MKAAVFRKDGKFLRFLTKASAFGGPSIIVWVEDINDATIQEVPSNYVCKVLDDGVEMLPVIVTRTVTLVSDGEKE